MKQAAESVGVSKGTISRWESGDIVVAMVNGEDATVKRLIKYSDGIMLQALNPAYEPMYFTREKQNEIPVTIWGKVVELRGKF